jgi:hypothetical protein
VSCLHRCAPVHRDADHPFDATGLHAIPSTRPLPSVNLSRASRP